MDNKEEKTENKAKKVGIIKRLWRWLWQPNAKWALGTLVFSGIIIGILLWGGFNWAMELSNSEEFCISCHEMKDNVYEEYKETIHYTNRTGVRAVCSDCHVPKEWIYKVVRKVQATKELYHKIIGTIDTPEKFRANRLEMAMREWTRMKKTDSRECRNCHDFASMDLDKQEPRSADKHDPFVWDAIDGIKPKKTCIDCHRGIAHKLAPGAEEAAVELFKQLELEGQ